MRMAILFLFSSFANMCFAIGWEEVPKENVQQRGISVNSEFNESMGCFTFKITLPSQLHFEDLGKMEFWSARYKVVSEKSRGWQLTSKGTQVSLPSTSGKQNIKIEGLCLSEPDLASAYLSVVYGGPQGAPPMIILLNLDGYMHLAEKGEAITENGFSQAMAKFQENIDESYVASNTNQLCDFFDQGDTRDEFQYMSDRLEDYASQDAIDRVQALEDTDEDEESAVSSSPS